MLELIQSIQGLTAVFVVAVLAILLIFGFRVLRLASGQRPNDRRADPRYAHLLRKTPF